MRAYPPFTACTRGVRVSGRTLFSSAFGLTLDLLPTPKFFLFSSFIGLKKSSAVLFSDATEGAAATEEAVITEGLERTCAGATTLPTEEVT